MKELGQRMKMARGRYGTQRAVIDRLAIVQSTISRWERGTTSPTVEQFLSFCQVVGAHPGALIDDFVRVPDQLGLHLTDDDEKLVVGLVRLLHERVPLVRAVNSTVPAKEN